MARHAAHADDGKSYKNKRKPNTEDKNFRRREVESLKRSEKEHYSSGGTHSTLPSPDSELYIRRQSGGTDSKRGEMPVYNKLRREKLPDYDFGITARLEKQKEKPTRLTQEELDELFESDDSKTKGKGVIIAVAIAVVIVAICVGVTIYTNGKKGNGDTAGSPSAADVDNPGMNNPAAKTSDLVVVTVSGKKIRYNSKPVADSAELAKILQKIKNPTLSLINLDADIDTYNSVAKVLNRRGGNFELMDENNTLPSIKSDKN